MAELVPKVWLITGTKPYILTKRHPLTPPNEGTSTGFGRRLVSSVLARGDRVIATARSLDTLQNTFTTNRENLHLVQLDVTEGEDSLKAKVNNAAAKWGRIDVLVNNAG